MNRLTIAGAVFLAAAEALTAAVEWLWPASLGGVTHWRGRQERRERQERRSRPDHPPARAVSLTFDDGPSAYTAGVLDVLRRESVRATFFVVGAQVERYPDLARRMVAEGHEIGNHTYSFAARPVPQRLFWPVPAAQVTRTQEVVRAVTGTTPRYFRSPGGQMGRPLWRAVRRQGLQIVNGALPIPRPESTAAAQLATIRRTVRGGAIIILHDGDDRHPDSARPRTTVELLPRLIPTLRARGYDIVPLSRLLGNGKTRKT